MNKKIRADYLKIIFVGIPLSFVVWAIIFALAAFLAHDLFISLFSSITLTFIFAVIYFYLSIKHPHKIGATINYSMSGFKTPQGLLKCADCGCESEAEEAFRKYKGGMFKHQVVLCPECWSSRYIERSKVSLIGMGIALVGGLIILYFDPSNSLAAYLINLVIIYLFMLLTIIPHELGHFLVGRLLGHDGFRVIIGYGQALFTRRFLGCEWEFRPFPIGGITIVATRSRKFFRFRRFILVFAGPMVNVILILALFYIPAKGSSLISYNVYGVAPAIDFLLANIILLGLNLFPYKITTAAGVIENDGLALIKVIFSDQKKIDFHIASYYFLASQELYLRKRYLPALEICEEGLKLYPDTVLLGTQLGRVFLSLNEFEKARSIFAELLHHRDISPGQKMIMLNNIAYADILSGRTDLMDEADRYSEEAYRNIPWMPAIKGTRGALLVETGRVDEGLQLLQKAYYAHSDPEGKALNAAHIAIGEKLRGNTGESARYLDIARTLDPQCQLLDRVYNELQINANP